VIKHTTNGQRFHLAIELSKVCSKDSDGYAIYAKGETDVTLAKRLGVPTGAVRKMRSEVFGLLRNRVGPRKTKGRSDSRLSQLAAEVKKLTDRVAELEDLVERYTSPKWTPPLKTATAMPPAVRVP
jgi:hypothetical protein